MRRVSLRRARTRASERASPVPGVPTGVGRTPKAELLIDKRLFKHQNLHNFTLVFSNLKHKYICFIYVIC